MNDKRRQSAKKFSRIFFAASIFFALCSFAMYLEVRSERQAVDDAAQAMESGVAMGGSAISQSEMRYKENRDAARAATFILAIIFLGLAARSKSSANP